MLMKFQELRNEVIARRKPRKMFVQPNLYIQEENNSFEEYAQHNGDHTIFMARYR